MPPKKRRANSKTAKSKTAKLPSVFCCVCCRPVNISKDEVLFCTGTCQEWIHRYCASVSVKAYQSIKDAGSPFLCFCCQQIRSQDEVTKLNDEVRQLKKEVTELKTELSTLGCNATDSTSYINVDIHMNNDTPVEAEIQNYETSGEWIEHPNLLLSNGASANPHACGQAPLTGSFDIVFVGEGKYHVSFVLDMSGRQFSVEGSPQNVGYTKEESLTGDTYQSNVRFYPQINEGV